MHKAFESGDCKSAHYNRVNAAEKRFVRWSESRGISSHRNGWPDFFCETAEGRLVGIEVKNNRDALSPDQVQCFRMLDRVGLSVYVFNTTYAKVNERGSPLVPWKEYAEGRPKTDFGAQAAGEAKITACQESGDSKPETSADASPASENGRNPEELDSPRLIH